MGRPPLTTWYVRTNLPVPNTEPAESPGALPAADVAEVVRLYGLRTWVEQSYKQTTLRWAGVSTRCARIW